MCLDCFDINFFLLHHAVNLESHLRIKSCKSGEDGQSGLPFSVVRHIWYFDRAVVQNVRYQIQPCNLKE